MLWTSLFLQQNLTYTNTESNLSVASSETSSWVTAAKLRLLPPVSACIVQGDPYCYHNYEIDCVMSSASISHSPPPRPQEERVVFGSLTQCCSLEPKTEPDPQQMLRIHLSNEIRVLHPFSQTGSNERSLFLPCFLTQLFM